MPTTPYYSALWPTYSASTYSFYNPYPVLNTGPDEPSGVWVKNKLVSIGSWIRITNGVHTGQKAIVYNFSERTVYLSNGFGTHTLNEIELISQDISRIQVGSNIILGYHDWIKREEYTNVRHYRNWDRLMEQFVGKQTVITKFSNKDGSGSCAARVEIDAGAFSWRLVNMSLVEGAVEL